MNKIKLDRLRDIAIEYLPEAQQARDNHRQWDKRLKLGYISYMQALWEAAMHIRMNASLSAVEQAAANLLKSVCMWQTYDPNDPELANIDPTEYRAQSMVEIEEAAKILAKVTGRDMAHLMPANAPAGKVENATDTRPDGNEGEDQTITDVTHDEILAALFDPVPVESLEKMFPSGGKWQGWVERAARNSLAAARVERAKFNPYKAGLWFVRKGIEGWDNARLYRTLKNNLPVRSRDDAHLLAGDID